MLISSQQTASVKNRFIGERLVFGIIEISGWFNITGFLLIMDIVKAFDSLDHSFLNSVLKKFGLEKKFDLDKNFIRRSTIVCHKWWNYPII